MNDPTIYIIEIPKEISKAITGQDEFTGVKAGMDFYKGKGSTASARDARHWQQRGCVVTDQEGKRLFIQSSHHPESRTEILTTHEAPVEDVPKPAEPTPRFVNKADREMQEALERKHAR
jgi:hypothetical protein